MAKTREFDFQHDDLEIEILFMSLSIHCLWCVGGGLTFLDADIKIHTCRRCSSSSTQTHGLPISVCINYDDSAPAGGCWPLWSWATEAVAANQNRWRRSTLILWQLRSPWPSSTSSNNWKWHAWSSSQLQKTWEVQNLLVLCFRYRVYF